jgi:hypothetical protein
MTEEGNVMDYFCVSSIGFRPCRYWFRRQPIRLDLLALHDGKATVGLAVALQGLKMETIVLLLSDVEENDDAY